MISTRKLLFSTTVLAGIMSFSAPALAQSASTPAQDEDATQVEEIVVTGSRIRRDPANAPTPLIQVSREQLQSTGQSTVIDYLATIPALSNSQVPSDTVGTGSVGAAYANLRSLGIGRTLTLVDGRRHVSSLGGSLTVDIDTIPRLLIDNIEIVTGGASSVYGADAVSGVLNFTLRRDFEGLEVDAFYGQINEGGEANQRISALAGVNLFDDRLNLWGFAEYEDLAELTDDDIDWLAANYAFVGNDVDPSIPAIGPFTDGVIDSQVYSGVRSLQRVRWSVVNLANNQPASPLTDPDIAYFNCTGPSAANFTNGNCTLPNPGYSYVFDGATARFTDFGTRIGTGLARLSNVGGDGENVSEFGQFTFFPEGSATRLAGGANWQITDDVLFRFDVKRVEEENYSMSQASFFDVFINDGRPADQVSQILNGSQYHIRLSDNAFLPANLRSAIQNNRLIVYTAPTNDQPSVPTGATIAAPFARAALRGQDRFQTNTRELTRFVASLEGGFDNLWFVDNVRWDIGYTYGEVDVETISTAVDTERQAYASDAVVDTLGRVGRPGEIVCRVRLLQAQNVASMPDIVRGGDLRANAVGQAAINECRPLNIFGRGNQSAEALNYIEFDSDLQERIEQEQALASISGELWDFWGAGPIAAAIGAEYRREYTLGLGFDDDNVGRLTQGFVTASTPASEYETEEWFAEVSIPLFRDSWLGEFAELSGSYRAFDYTTVGTGDVFGVNLIYRPIRDITFRSSFNNSFRAPSLTENFATLSPSFANFAFSDPCSTANIIAPGNARFRDNRVANCTALAAARGLTFDFAGATPQISDDFDPTVLGSGSVRGSTGGNPFLQPEESDSFTFSTVIAPRMFPDLTVVLDYYEIELTNVIASVTAITAAENCVNGATLNTAACATIFRNNPNLAFAIGSPVTDPIGAYIQGSINYAKRTTRGLDFTARYSLDLEENFGLDWGRLDYSLQGSWLIEQKNFNNAQNPADFTESASAIFFPRVRMTSRLTYTPTDNFSVTWSVDWQSAQDSSSLRSLGQTGNPDARIPQYFNTGNFARHDLSVRYELNDEVTLRTGVTNIFDAEQPRFLGTTLTSNFDPYGTRFFVGLNYRPF